MPTNKEIFASYFADSPSSSDPIDFPKWKQQQKTITAYCKLCRANNTERTVSIHWTTKKSSTYWSEDSIRGHLEEWHQDDWRADIAPRLRTGTVPARRTTVRSSTAVRSAKEWINRSGACPSCGRQLNFTDLLSHRSVASNGGKGGCPAFGTGFDDNGASHELLAAIAEDHRQQMTVDDVERAQAQHLQQFKEFMQQGVEEDCIPVHADDLKQKEEDQCVYVQLLSLEPVYFGRTSNPKRREGEHNNKRQLLVRHGVTVDGATTILLAEGLTLVESMGGEYLALLLKQLDKMKNCRLPGPYIPHSRSAGAEHMEENLQLHRQGKRLLAALLLDALELFKRRPDIAVELIEESDQGTSSGAPTPVSRRQASRMQKDASTPAGALAQRRGKRVSDVSTQTDTPSGESSSTSAVISPPPPKTPATPSSARSDWSVSDEPFNFSLTSPTLPTEGIANRGRNGKPTGRLGRKEQEDALHSEEPRSKALFFPSCQISILI